MEEGLPREAIQVTDECAFHLQVESDQATSPTDVGSRKHRLLWTGFGLVGLLMLTLAIHSHASPAQSPSASTNSAAFSYVPTVAFRPAGLRASGPRVSQGRPIPRMAPFRMSIAQNTNRYPYAVKLSSIPTRPGPSLDQDHDEMQERLMEDMQRDMMEMEMQDSDWQTHYFLDNEEALPSKGKVEVKAPTAKELWLAEVQNPQPTTVPHLHLDGGADFKFTVPELKAMLKERGLPVSGKKAELIERLETSKSKSKWSDSEIQAMLEANAHAMSEWREGISKRTVPELKAMLKEKGLPRSGKKAQLVKELEIARLLDLVEKPEMEKTEVEAPGSPAGDRRHEIGSFWQGSQSMGFLDPLPPPGRLFAAVVDRAGGKVLYVYDARDETGKVVDDEAEAVKALGRELSVTASDGTRGVDLLKHLYSMGPKARELMWKLPVHDVQLMQNALDGTAPEKVPMAEKHPRDDGHAWASKSHRIWQKLEESRGAYATYHLAQSSQAAVAEMEAAGVPFNSHGLELLVQQWRDELAREEAEVSFALGGSDHEPINLGSSKQLGEIIAKLAAPEELATWPRTPKGALKTDSDSMLQSSFPFARQLVRCRELKHLLSHYSSIGATADAGGGRLFPVYQLGGAVTGRMSASNPNVQAFPRAPEFRALVSAASGGWLVKGDFSQVELRVLAEVSGDTRMRNAFQRGEDLHTLTAAELQDVPLQDVSKEQRQLAKAVNFGLIYGMGAKGLQQYAKSSYGVHMTGEEAQKARQRFFQAYPGVAAWQQEVREQVARGEKVVTPTGRVAWHLLGASKQDYSKDAHWTSNAEREAMNFPIQGGAAEVMLAGLAGLTEFLQSRDVASQTDPKAACRLITVVHDEFVLECASGGAANAAAAVLSEAMQAAWLRVFPASAPLGQAGVSISIGGHWGELK